jgi:hypothetical protein
MTWVKQLIDLALEDAVRMILGPEEPLLEPLRKRRHVAGLR